MLLIVMQLRPGRGGSLSSPEGKKPIPDWMGDRVERRFVELSLRRPIRDGSPIRLVPWRQGRHRPRAATAGIYVTSTLAFLYVALSFSGELQQHVVPSTAGAVLIGLAAATFLFHRARLLGWSRAWLFMSISMFLVQFTGAGYFLFALISGTESALWVLFATYLISYPPLFIALLALSREDGRLRTGSRLNRTGEWLDSAIVLFGGGMAVVFVGFLPAIRANRGDTTTLVFLACNAVMMLLLLLAAARYALIEGSHLATAGQVSSSSPASSEP